MPTNQLADFFAKLSFKVDMRGLQRFEKSLENLEKKAQQIQARMSVQNNKLVSSQKTVLAQQQKIAKALGLQSKATARNAQQVSDSFKDQLSNVKLLQKVTKHSSVLATTPFAVPAKTENKIATLLKEKRMKAATARQTAASFKQQIKQAKILQGINKHSNVRAVVKPLVKPPLKTSPALSAAAILNNQLKQERIRLASAKVVTENFRAQMQQSRLVQLAQRHSLSLQQQQIKVGEQQIKQNVVLERLKQGQMRTQALNQRIQHSNAMRAANSLRQVVPAGIGGSIGGGIGGSVASGLSGIPIAATGVVAGFAAVVAAAGAVQHKLSQMAAQDVAATDERKVERANLRVLTDGDSQKATQ